MLFRIKSAIKTYLRTPLFVAVWLIYAGIPATAQVPENSTVTAALALNFARFTEWPGDVFESGGTSVRLCVLGDNVTQEAFSQIDTKQVGSRTLSVIHLARIKNSEQCHILYISALDRGSVIQLLAELRGKPVLTIGSEEKHFLEDGGMVLLKLVEGKMNIEINLNAANSSGLKISSRVLQLAKIVNP
jgi:hypothetical protein